MCDTSPVFSHGKLQGDLGGRINVLRHFGQDVQYLFSRDEAFLKSIFCHQTQAFRIELALRELQKCRSGVVMANPSRRSIPVE